MKIPHVFLVVFAIFLAAVAPVAADDDVFIVVNVRKCYVQSCFLFLVTGVDPPEPVEPILGDVKQKFAKPLKLTCRIKESKSRTRFSWFKNDKELKTGDKEGLVIKVRK